MSNACSTSAALRTHVLNQPRQRIRNLAHAEAVNERETPGTAIRIQDLQPALDVLARGAAADLDPDRVLDPAEVLDVRAVRIVRAQPGPGKMREQIEVAGTMRDAAGLRRFVAEVQRLMRREEVDFVGIAGPHPEHVFDELERVLDGLHHAMVFGR